MAEADAGRVAEWRRLAEEATDIPQWATTEELMRASIEACHRRPAV